MKSATIVKVGTQRPSQTGQTPSSLDDRPKTRQQVVDREVVPKTTIPSLATMSQGESLAQRNSAERCQMRSSANYTKVPLVASSTRSPPAQPAAKETGNRPAGTTSTVNCTGGTRTNTTGVGVETIRTLHQQPHSSSRQPSANLSQPPVRLSSQIRPVVRRDAGGTNLKNSHQLRKIVINLRK